MRQTTPHPALAALLVVVFLMTAGCGGTDVSKLPKAAAPSTSVAPADPEVVVSGIDQEDLEVSDTQASSPGVNLSYGSPIYTVESAQSLSGPSQVQLQLDNALPRTVPIYVASRTKPGTPWSYAPASLMSDQRHVQFTTSQLGDFAVLVMDLDGALQTFRDDLKSRLSFALDRSVDKPDCAATEEARKDGYSVVSTKGRKTVSWCFGYENSQRVLKVTNRRTQPIQIGHPNAPVVPPAVETPKAYLPWAAVLGTESTLLAPGRSVSYDVDLEPTKNVLISAVSTAKAQSLRVMQATTAALVARNNGFRTGKRLKSIPTVAALLARKQCASALGQDAAKLLAGCFSRRKVMATFGETGRLLSKLVGDPTTKTFLGQQLTTIAAGVRKDGNQNILVRRAKPDFSAFVGSFTGTVRMLTVSDTGLVFESVNNEVTDKKTGLTTTVRVLDVYYQLSNPRTENGVSGADAEITKIKVYDRTGFNGRLPRVGDTGRFAIEKGKVRSPFVGRLYCGSGSSQKACR